MRAMTARQAAQRVGVSPQTFIRWIDVGEGPRAFVKVGPKGRTIRIRVEDFESWYRQHSRGKGGLS